MHKNVENLEKRSWDILTRQEIRTILYPELWSEESDIRLSQHIYALKGSGLLVALKNSLYYVQDMVHPLSPDRVVHDRYWHIVKKIVHESVWNEAIIGSEKSLELHMRDTSPPELLILYTPSFTSRIRLSPWYAIHFRTLKTWKKSLQKNAFRMLHRESEREEIEGEKFSFLSPEAALLDTLTIHSHADGITDSLVLRFLKRHGHALSREKLGMLTAFRYIRAMNRLRTLAKTMSDTKIYEMTLEVIKNEWGGCFLTL